MEAQAYRARRPKSSPLWQCLDAHFDTFLDIYPEAYEHDYGFLRPIIPEVVGKFMGCGDFAKGFARVRCDHCAHGDSIIYRSGMNPKIQRNFEVFNPCDFIARIARITQHIPDKSFQLVCYYGWYSNKMRGQRIKQTDTEVGTAPEGEVIDVSAFKPRRIPSKKWRELIKKVWEADPLLCPHCQHEMRIVALIDEAAVIERILRHLGLWEAGVRVDAARDPPEPVEPVIELWLDDPFPDYDNEPVFAEN